MHRTILADRSSYLLTDNGVPVTIWIKSHGRIACELWAEWRPLLSNCACSSLVVARDKLADRLQQTNDVNHA